MKPFLIAIALLVLPVEAEAKLKVVTTLASFADIASKVGGDEVDAVSLTRGSQDPHFVDAKPDLILKMNRADLLIRVGLGLEDGWLPPLVTGSRNSRIQPASQGNLEASTLVTLKEVPTGALDRSQGDVHPGGNPHFMLDPRNGVLFAQGIAERLAKLDPPNAAAYRKRAETYVAELKTKISEWEAAFKPLSGRPVVTYHKSWVYFAGWVGLDVVGHVEPKAGVPPSPEHVVRLVGLMKEKKAKQILIEPYYPKSASETVAEKVGAKVVVLPNEVNGVPEAKSYIAVFDAIANRLK